MSDGRNDPYKSFRYRLEIDGIDEAGFSEVKIPDIQIPPIEYREGNEVPTTRKLPGLVKYGNVNLKWGITDSIVLYDWIKLVMDGKISEARKNVAIILMDEEGNDANRWEFTDAWPTKYDAPSLKATGAEVAIENLEIAHEGMKRVK